MPKLPKLPRIDTKDLKQMAAMAIPILLLLTLDYMFEDMFRKLDEFQQFTVFFALVLATAWAYQTLLKKWIK